MLGFENLDIGFIITRIIIGFVLVLLLGFAWMLYQFVTHKEKFEVLKLFRGLKKPKDQWDNEDKQG